MRLGPFFFTAFVVVTLVPLAAGAILADQAMQRTTREASLDQLASTAQAQRSAVEDLLETNQEMLALILNDPDLASDLKAHRDHDDTEALARIAIHLRRSVGSTQYFQNATIHGLDGVDLVGTNPGHHAEAHTEPFEIGLKDPQVTLLIRNEDHVINYLSGPIRYKGETLGVLVIESSPDRIFAIAAQRAGLGRTGETLLAESTPEGARFLTPLRFDPDAALRRVIPWDEVDVPVIQALSGQEGIVENAPDYRNVPVAASVNHISEADWAIIVKKDQSELEEPVAALRSLLALSMVPAVAVVIMGGVIMTTLVTRPFKELTEHVQEVRAGNTHHRVRFNRFLTPYEAQALLDSTDAMTQRLDRIAEARLRILRTIGHELRTPLTPLSLDSLRLQKMADQRGDEELLKIAAHLRNCYERLTQITQRTVEASRIGAEDMRLELKKFDLAPVLETLAAAYQAQAAEQGIRIELRIPGHIPVRADLGAITKVLQTLLDNAIQFSPDGGTITVEAGTSRDGTMLTVQDTGIGFRSDETEAMFDLFATSETAEQKGLNRAGLSLALAKTLMDLHAGQITAASEGEGKGAKFTVTLPQ